MITPPQGWLGSDSSSEELGRSGDSNGACPNCQSGDWKLASLVYRDGLSTISSRTKGGGLGVGRVGLRAGNFAVGGGVYRSRTSGVQQTLLSAQCSPPRMRTGLIILLAALCLLFTWIAITNIAPSNISLMVWDGFIAAMLGLAAVTRYHRQRRKYDAGMERYNSTRVCQRCGTLYSGNLDFLGEREEEDKGLVQIGLLALLAILAGLFLWMHQQYSTRAIPIAKRSSGLSGDNMNMNHASHLPTYIAKALRSPDLSPSSPGGPREIVLGSTGQTLLIPAISAEDCEGSGGCNWKLVDGATQTEVLPDSLGSLYRTAKITNGYYDIVVDAKWSVYVYEFRASKYVSTFCYDYQTPHFLGSPIPAVTQKACNGE